MILVAKREHVIYQITHQLIKVKWRQTAIFSQPLLLRWTAWVNRLKKNNEEFERPVSTTFKAYGEISHAKSPKESKKGIWAMNIINERK